LSQSSARS